MHQVYQDKIIFIEDGTQDLVFTCIQPKEVFSQISTCVYFDYLVRNDTEGNMSHLSETQREIYIWKVFETEIIPRIESGERLYLNGTFTKKIFDYIRNIYQSAGYFISSENRYKIPNTAQITLGINIVHLNYQSKQRNLLYISQSTIRANIAALNDGCIARIYILPEDQREIMLYLQQSHIQLQRFAAALIGWQEILPEEVLRIFNLRALPLSWNEVPHE